MWIVIVWPRPRIHVWQISYERFGNLFNKESCVYFESKEDNEICSFAIVEDFAIRLICVIPPKQGHGIGTKLISDIEKHAGDRGFDKLITGGVSSRLFIGAISESWRFFATYDFDMIINDDNVLNDSKT